MHYRFDWDPEKEVLNVRKHRVSFRRAATTFRDPNQLTLYDEEHSETEERWVTVGLDSTGILRVVVHTFEQVDEHLCEIRIISARRAAIKGGRAVSGEKDMKAGYDSSKGERGRFYNPDAVFSFPVYLEPDVDNFLSTLADDRDINIQDLVNEWLRMNIQMIQSVQQQG